MCVLIGGLGDIGREKKKGEKSNGGIFLVLRELDIRGGGIAVSEVRERER